MRPTVLALLLAAAPAAASEPGGPASGLTVTAALGGGAEVGRRASTGMGELELGLGWELGDVRPEVGLLLGLSPGTYAGVRPGLHVSLREAPFYGRAAVDVSHTSGDWRVRWLLLGAGAELRLTSVLGAFAEADAGIPLRGDRGVALLARAGFAIRF